MLKISRKGIYYLRDFKKGQKVTFNNLFLRRPWGGLSMFDIKKKLKNRLLKDVKKNEKVKINDFKSNIILGSGGHSRVILENLYILKKKNIKIYDFNFSSKKNNTILKKQSF